MVSGCVYENIEERNYVSLWECVIIFGDPIRYSTSDILLAALLPQQVRNTGLEMDHVRLDTGQDFALNGPS